MRDGILGVAIEDVADDLILGVDGGRNEQPKIGDGRRARLTSEAERRSDRDGKNRATAGERPHGRGLKLMGRVNASARAQSSRVLAGQAHEGGEPMHRRRARDFVHEPYDS